MRFAIVTVVAILFTASAPAAEWVNKPALTFDEKAGKWYATFELDTFSDVEVAIVDPAKATVVRHLAAGVLGPKAPPPFAANSRSQKFEWDGKNDYRTKVLKPESLVLRVRAGMSVALEQIVGGDPYAYYSEEIGHNDHSPFRIYGLEAKPDGKVYVLGYSSKLGPPALRQFDIDGNEILHFGTYGNRDSMGGLAGDPVPIKGIPLAFPNSVEATDNYIYVADMLNLRLLRIKKNFKAEATSR